MIITARRTRSFLFCLVLSVPLRGFALEPLPLRPEHPHRRLAESTPDAKTPRPVKTSVSALDLAAGLGFVQGGGSLTAWDLPSAGDDARLPGQGRWVGLDYLSLDGGSARSTTGARTGPSLLSGASDLNIDIFYGNSPFTYAAANGSSTYNNLAIGAVQGGEMDQTGGSITASAMQIGGGGIGIFNQSGGTLTLTGANGLRVAVGSSLLQSGGTIDLTPGGGSSLYVGNGGTATFSGTSLFKTALVTFAGGTINLNGGTLQVAGNAGSNESGNFYFNGGTLQLGGTFTDLFPGVGLYVRSGGATIDTNGFNLTIAQNLLHSNVGGDNATDGGLTKNGAGMLTLTGSNTFSGSTTVNGGTLVLGNGTAAVALGPVAVNNAAGFQLAANARVTGIAGTQYPLTSGGTGVSFAAGGTLTNAGTIGGGNGGSNNGGAGGGLAVSFDSGGSVTNTGSVAGGNGGNGSNGYGGGGGSGIFFTGVGSLTNSGSIDGGSGGGGRFAGSGGSGGSGVAFAAAGSLTNSGAISGGHQANGGSAGNGATFSGGIGTLVNLAGGTITGGVVMDNYANVVTLQIGSQITGGLNVGTSTAATLTLTDNGTGGSQTYSAAVDSTTFSGALIKSGSGTWTLDQTLTYTGGTTINAGTLSIASIANGGTASPLGASTNASANLYLNGGTLAYTGANAASDRGMTINPAGGTLAVTNPGTVLTLNGAVVGGTPASYVDAVLTVTGPGTLVLGGTVDDGFLGATVSGGTLVLGKSSSGSVHALGGPGLTINGGTVQLAGTGGDQIYDGAGVTVNDGGTFDLAGQNETIGTLNGTGLSTVTNSSTTAGSTLIVGAGTFSGTFGSSGGSILLIKNFSTNTLILSGERDNSHLSANADYGTLLLAKDSNSAVHAVAGQLTIAAPGIVQLGGSGNDQIADSAPVNMSGASTFDLNGRSETIGSLNSSGDNSNRSSVINTSSGASTLTVGSDAISGSGTGTFSGTIGSVATSGSPPPTPPPTVLGRATPRDAGTATLALVKAGSGTFTLTGQNTYTGGTTFQNGELSVSADANLGDSSGGLTFNGGALQVTGTSYNSTARTITWGANGGGFDITDAGNAFTVSQALALGGALTKLGSGTLVLANSADNNNLAATVNAGTLVLGAASNGSVHAIGGTGLTINNGGTAQLGGTGLDQIYDGAGVTVNGGTFDLNGHNETVGNLNGSGGLVTTGVPGSSTLTVGGTLADGSGTFAGLIQDGGGRLSLIKNGSGTLTLAGQNTFTGGTTINAGSLVLGDGTNPATLRGADGLGPSPTGYGPSGTVAVTLNGGTLQLQLTATVSGGNGLAGMFAGNGGNGGNGGAAVVFNNSGSLTNAGSISGGGGGGGSTNEAGGNGGAGVIFAADGSLINSGTIRGGDGGDSFFFGGNGATAVTFAAAGSLTNSGTITGGGGAGGGNIYQGGNSGNGVSFSLGGSLINHGTINGLAGGIGLLSTGTNGIGASFSGAAGTLENDPGGTITGGVVMGNYANTVTLYDGSKITGGLNMGTSASATLTLTGAGMQTYSAAVDNTTFSGTLIKTGNGTWTLDRAMTPTGGVQINGGVLGLGSASALGTTGPISFEGGTLQYGASDTTDYSGRIVVADNAAAISIDTNNQNVTFATSIANPNNLGLVKLGLGTLTLAGTSDNGGLGATVNGGTLVLAKANTGTNPDLHAIGTPGLVINTGGTVKLGGSGGDQIIDSAIVYINGGTFDLAGQSETIGPLSGSTTSTITNSSPGTRSTLTLGGTGGFGGVIQDGAGTLALVKTGGQTIALTGQNTFTGGVGISGGTLEIDTAGALGSAGTISFTAGMLQYGATTATDYSGRIAHSTGAISLFINGQNVTFASPLDGTNTGGLSKLGEGTLTLNAPNSFGGTIQVVAGTLAVGANGALSNGKVFINAGGTLDLKSTVTSAHNHFTGTALMLPSGSGSIVDLEGIGIQDIVGSLFVAGVMQPPGTYGAPGSGAMYTGIADFVGTGELQVVPEPSTWFAVAVGLGGAAVYRRRRRSAR